MWNASGTTRPVPVADSPGPPRKHQAQSTLEPLRRRSLVFLRFPRTAPLPLVIERFTILCVWFAFPTIGLTHGHTDQFYHRKYGCNSTC